MKVTRKRVTNNAGNNLNILLLKYCSIEKLLVLVLLKIILVNINPLIIKKISTPK